MPRGPMPYDAPTVTCTNAICAAFHSIGAVLYLDAACAAILFLEAAILLWRLRQRGDRRFFAVPLVLGLLALALSWHHWALYQSWLPSAPVPPSWLSGEGYLHDGPEPLYTPALVVLTALVVLAGLVRALGKEPRWRL